MYVPRRNIRRQVRLLSMMVVMAILSSNNSSFAANGSVTYTYDALGRVSTTSYDTGVFVIYSYDANGNRTQQVINLNATTLVWSATSSPCTSNCWGQSLW
jgi:hypothetical protein